MRTANGRLVCYNIFQRISDSKYAVQSRDIYEEGSIDKLLTFFQKQKILLFMEQEMNSRGLFENTIESSIIAFENSFEQSSCREDIE